MVLHMISGIRVASAMLGRHSNVVVSRGLSCCIRRARYPKRSSFALLGGRPGAVAVGSTTATTPSSLLFNPGIGASAVSGRVCFRASSISEARMAGGGTTDGEAGSASHKHTNRLAKEQSPYLLQHAHNPVRIPPALRHPIW